LESTVVDATSDVPVILRHGGVTAQELRDVAGEVLTVGGEELKRRSPGTRHRHYAPSVPVFLWTGGLVELGAFSGGVVGYVGLDEPPCGVSHAVRARDVREYARELFRSFREMERMGVSAILAQVPPKGDPMGDALFDRLFRASGGRTAG
jgi:L-threonylcarbamoyladenylate synthase